MILLNDPVLCFTLRLIDEVQAMISKIMSGCPVEQVWGSADRSVGTSGRPAVSEDMHGL
jgi:hypothetical protein